MKMLQFTYFVKTMIDKSKKVVVEVASFVSNPVVVCINKRVVKNFVKLLQ